MSEANKAVIRRYFEEMLRQRNLALADELFSANLLVQAPNHPELRSREARRQFIASMFDAFPDLHFTVDESIAEGEKVVSRWFITGTHLKEFMGIAATGNKVSFGGTSTFRIADGMIAEELIQWDALGFMQQLGAVPSLTEANKALVRRYVEGVINKGNFALVDEIFSADTISHGPEFPELRGREAKKQYFVSVRRAFPDVHFTVDELIAEGEKVVMRWSDTGTHQGEFWGIAPTGRKVYNSGTSTFRIADGLIAEELIQWDSLGFMKEVGVVQPLGQEERNKAIVMRCGEEIWNKGNLSAIEEFYSHDINHMDPAIPEIRGIEAEKQVVVLLRTAFPDIHLTVVDLITEGDKVVVRWTLRGTHKGDFQGVPATGKPIEVTGTSTNRFANGKIVEAWANWDALGLMRQLGAVTLPEVKKAQAAK